MVLKKYGKIAENSLYLYIKLFVSTVLGLYVSRIVLLELGAESFGLYVVVGGFVSMLNFLNETLLATTNRFISVEIGKGKDGEINKVFNNALIIHIILSFFLIITAELLGTWYIYNYLNVSADKIPDAIFVLHFSILTTFFSIISLPFQGLIVSREKFLAKSVIEIISILIKFILVLLLLIYIGNKLRLYAIIMSVVMFIPTVSFIVYCYLKYREDILFKLNKDIDSYKKMLSFSGWILLGTFAQVGRGHGTTLIVNLFFGVFVNAAFGIASQIYSYVMMFVHNLNQAAVPYIIKTQSAGETEKSINIVYSFSKYVFFVMILFSFPILMSIDTILVLWLKEVPELTKEFTILMIINGLIGSVGSSLGVPVSAAGDIRKSQVWYSITLLSILPISYLLFVKGYSAYFITIVMIGSTFANVIIQAIITAEKTVFKIKDYLIKSIFPVVLVALSMIPQIFLRSYFGNRLIDVLFFSIISFGITLIIIHFFGLNQNEKKTLKNFIVTFKNKIINQS